MLYDEIVLFFQVPTVLLERSKSYIIHEQSEMVQCQQNQVLFQNCEKTTAAKTLFDVLPSSD